MMSVLDRWCDRADRLPLALLVIFFVVVALAGGSARADVLGQSVVRGVAVTVMIVLVASGTRIDTKTYRPLFLLLAACIVWILIELVPLPPALWSSLPGRAMFVAATKDAGLSTPWRPIAIYPDGAVNALFSLLVPTAACLCIAALSPRGVRRLLPMLVVWTLASAVLTLLQASGGWFANPFINDQDRQFSGFFANRNHDALFLAIGTAATAYWGLATRRRTGRRVALAAGLMMLLFLTNLVTGSRAGLLLEILALALGILTTAAYRSDDAATARRRGLFSIVIVVITVVFLLGLSFAFNRAVSIDRVFDVTTKDEPRLLAAPTVLDQIKVFAPLGSGAGSFDQAFRLAEPLALLDPTYMNHAHNDWLEVPLEYGVVGVVIALCAFLGCLRICFSIWRSGREASALPRLGSLVILFLAIAAVTDYAMRTPAMMVVAVIAGAWLCAPRHAGWAEHVALRREQRRL